MSYYHVLLRDEDEDTVSDSMDYSIVRWTSAPCFQAVNIRTIFFTSGLFLYTTNSCNFGACRKMRKYGAAVISCAFAQLCLLTSPKFITTSPLMLDVGDYWRRLLSFAFYCHQLFWPLLNVTMETPDLLPGPPFAFAYIPGQVRATLPPPPGRNEKITPYGP